MRFLILLLAFVLASCNAVSVDAERDAQARAVYEQFRTGDFDSLRLSMTEAMSANASDEQLAALRTQVYRPDPPSEAKTLTWQWNTQGSITAYETVHEFDHADGLVRFTTLMVREGQGDWEVDGFHIVYFTEAQVALAGFRLSGKSPVHYIILVLAAAAPVLCLVTVGVAAWRRRWLWMVGSLFGVGQFTLNWMTGAVEFNIAHIALLGAGYFKGGGALDPWIIFLSIPVPAIMFWLLQRWRPRPPKQKTRERPEVVALD